MEFKWIFYLILVLVIITVVQKGFDELKAQPINSVIDTSVDTVKSIIDFTKEKTSSATTTLGLIPCETNTDCNRLDECSDSCICNLETGECFQ